MTFILAMLSTGIVDGSNCPSKAELIGTPSSSTRMSFALEPLISTRGTPSIPTLTSTSGRRTRTSSRVLALDLAISSAVMTCTDSPASMAVSDDAVTDTSPREKISSPWSSLVPKAKRGGAKRSRSAHRLARMHITRFIEAPIGCLGDVSRWISRLLSGIRNRKTGACNGRAAGSHDSGASGPFQAIIFLLRKPRPTRPGPRSHAAAGMGTEFSVAVMVISGASLLFVLNR